MKRVIKILTVSTVLFFILLVPFCLADSLNQQETFYVDSNYDSTSRTNVIAVNRYVSDHAYFYIEQPWWNSLSSYKRIKAENKIVELAEEFDEVIYPQLTDFFGSVWDRGIDGDSRITILMSNLKSKAGGYFDSCNQYLDSQCKDSNQREMIYVNVNYLFERNMKGYIAHELQHLINWNQKERLHNKEEDVWLNELRSEFVPSLLGYNDPYSGSILEQRIKDFLNAFHNPLGEWKGESGDYGVITLFGQYLANQFGKTLFSSMIRDDSIGIESINNALQQAGYSEDFEQVFTNWSLANYYNSLGMGRGSKYGYTNSVLKDIHISPLVYNISSYGFVSFSERVKDWSPRWYLLNNSLPADGKSVALKLEFESENEKSDFTIPYMINYKDGHYELGFINLENQIGTSYIFNFFQDVESVLLVPANHAKKTNFTNDDPSTLFTLKASTVIINQPVISSIFPAQGSVLGGEIVEIRGGNFEQGIEVYFGGEKSSEVEFIDDTYLKVKVPAHQSGLVNVWIKNPDGKGSVFAQGYQYVINTTIADGSLIRAQGDYKVYIIQDGYKRHILDGRIFDFYEHLNWANIIEITPEERDSYITSSWVRAVNDKKVYEINGDKTKHWLNMTAEQFLESGRRWEGVFVINRQERNFYQTGAAVLYE